MTYERIANPTRSPRWKKIVPIVWAGLMVTMVGCSSDDSTTTQEDASGDSAVVADAAVQGSDVVSKDAGAKADGSAPDAPTTKDGSTADATKPDSSVPDASVNNAEAGTADAGADRTTTDAVADRALTPDTSTLEAGSDARTDASVADAASSDAASSDGASSDAASSDAPAATSEAAAEASTTDAGDGAAASTALHWCPLLDTDWGIGPTISACTNETTDACPDRANTWSTDVMQSFSAVLGADCRISAMLDGINVDDYVNQLVAWTIEVMGCPNLDASPGPVKFGLIPSDQSTHVFTTADLKVLSDLYVDAVNAALASPTTTASSDPLTPLTTQQIADLRAQLAHLAATRPGTLTSNLLSFNSCPADAGTDAHD